MEFAKALLPDFVAKTRSETKCYFYEFLVNEASADEIFCREAYVDAQGVLTHLDNVEELLKKLTAVADVTRCEVHGPVNELAKLKSALAKMNPTYFVTSSSAV